MSDLTRCNYCTLQNIKRRAKEEGNKVILKPGWRGGTDVYVVPKGVAIPKEVKSGTDKEEGDEFHKKYCVAWFMELTSHCAC